MEQQLTPTLKQAITRVHRKGQAACSSLISGSGYNRRAIALRLVSALMSTPEKVK